MDVKTNTGLVAYAQAQLGLPYWYGTFGQTASSALLADRRTAYPKYYDQSKYKVPFTSQYGQRVHDCIGLIMGAIRAAGGSWPGLHGSNYAARNETASLSDISSVSALKPGELVYKVRSPGGSGYALPDRYKSGSDLRDYYHVGVVLSVSPLRIRHMSTPGMLIDTKLGNWRRHGWCKRIALPEEAAGKSGTAPAEAK